MQQAVTVVRYDNGQRWVLGIAASKPRPAWQRWLTLVESAWRSAWTEDMHLTPLRMGAGEGTEEGRATKAAPYDGAALERHLEAILRRDRLKVLKVLMGYVKHPQEAEDLAQDVFIKVLERLKQGYEPGAIPSAWVMRVTVNLAVDRVRSAWFRRVQPVDTLPETAEKGQRQDAGPEVAVLQKERETVVLTAIQKLPVNQRTVIMLFYFHDQRIEEIAAVLDIQVGAVKTRLFRGRERLKALLGAHGDDWQSGEDDV